MGITGRHERQSHPLGECDGKLQSLPLNLQPVVLDLDEIAIAKRAMEPGRMFFTTRYRFFFGVAREQRPTQLT
jgi:hypothetical protein